MKAVSARENELRNSARRAAVLQCLAEDLRSYGDRLPSPDPVVEEMSRSAEKIAAQLLVRNLAALA